MKLQFEITNVVHSTSRVTLKPINCALKGTITYVIPKRAVDLCKVGAVVEATIPLPDQYPVQEPEDHGAGARACYHDLRVSLAEILKNWPETRSFGALTGLNNAINSVRAAMFNEAGTGNFGEPLSMQCATSGAGSLLVYAKAFKEMAERPHAPYYADRTLIAAADELVKISINLLERLNVVAWKTTLG